MPVFDCAENDKARVRAERGLCGETVGRDQNFARNPAPYVLPLD
ncbi:hypothetical protein OKW32_003559 [Paraburkholderia youngii]